MGMRSGWWCRRQIDVELLNQWGQAAKPLTEQLANFSLSGGTNRDRVS
jgi:hypothetical protein